MPTRFRSAVTLIALLTAFAFVPYSTAYAGEAARNCDTFYAQGNPASGWGFTVCIKLQHDTNNRTWRATASASTSTPGLERMNLYVYHALLGGGSVERYAHDGYVTANTPWILCRGRVSMTAWASVEVRWPNGVWSERTNTFTVPRDYTGNC